MDIPTNIGEEGYLQLLEHILIHGTDKTDRTGVGTRSVFGAQLRFPLHDGFPLLTTKKVFTKGVFAELAWLIRGETNIKSLTDQGVHIWDEWADENGDLGPVYGEQWRKWDSAVYWNAEKEGYFALDQLQAAVDTIKTDPDSRRIMVTAWNPRAVSQGQMALPPCHLLYQFEVSNNELSCHMYMRSADMFLGVPFNIASYAALTHLIAHLTNLDVGNLVVSFGDAHIYNNHVGQVREQLSRRDEIRAKPLLQVNPFRDSLDKVITSDFMVFDYDPHPPIKAPVAV